jgi:hypothetical protein
MRAYAYREQLDGSTEEQIVSEKETRQTAAFNAELAKAAYDWNNALQIAAERMWSDRDLLYRLVPRK